MDTDKAKTAMTDKTYRRHLVLLWCFSAFSLFVFLWRNALWKSENRWAEIAREMLVTGDIWHPAINWQIYFDKPLLTYWVILPFAKIFGDVELVSRIPSAIAVLLTMYAVIKLAEKTFDRTAALLAGWMTFSCYGIIFWGRTAAADAPNMAAVLLAVAYFFYVEERAKFHNYLIFYLIMFLGAQMKGLPAILVPPAVIAPYLLYGNRWKKHLKIGNFAALFIGAAAFLFPFYMASVLPWAPLQEPPPGPQLSGLELVWRENITRAVNAFDHKDPFFSYLYNLPRIMLPWSLLVIAGIAGLAANWRRLPEKARALLLGTLLAFIMFSCSTSRRWYYVLPLAPLCVILGCGGLSWNFSWGKVSFWAEKLMRYLVIAAGVIALAAGLALPFLLGVLAKYGIPWMLPLAIGLGGVLTVLLFYRNKAWAAFSGLPERLSLAVAGGAIFITVGFSIVHPLLDCFRTEKPFALESARQMREAKIAEENIFFYDFDAGAALIFYWQTRKPCIASEEPEVFSKFLRERAGKQVAILLRAKKEKDFLKLRNTAAQCGVKLGEPNFAEENEFFTKPGSKSKWHVWYVTVPGTGK